VPFVLSPEPDDVLLRGQLITVPAPETTAGSKTTISDTLFVDDGAFPFDSREEMLSSLPIIKETFAKLGLLMHVGTVDSNGKPTKSKMEAMYFPARPAALALEQLVPETMHFGDNDCFHVHYTNEFKYLGSRLVPTLSDE